MPIRNRLSRMMRKSGSSSGSGSTGSQSSDGRSEAYTVSSVTPTTTTPISSTAVGLRLYTSAPARFSKKTTWRSNASSAVVRDDVMSFSPSRKPPPKRSAKSAPRQMHPSERALSESNLRHQQMLGTFTMKFGRKRGFSSGKESNLSGISPCNSRSGSMDICRSPGPEDEDEAGPSGQGQMSPMMAGLSIADKDT